MMEGIRRGKGGRRKIYQEEEVEEEE